MPTVLLHDHLDRWAARRPDAEFAVQGERRTTWAQARDASARAARALRAAGLAPGDRCAVLARNAVEYLLLYVAASRAGVVLVPLNPRSAPAEWDLVVSDATAMLLVCGAGFDGVRLPPMPVVGLGELFAPGPAEPPRRPGPTELLRLYTGGTTGTPKGAALHQGAVTSAMAQIADGPHGGRPGERALVVAPLSHAGVVWSALAPLAWGASFVFADGTVPADLVRALDERRIGYAALVPAVLGPMADVPRAADRAYPALRLLHTGSAPTTARTLRRASEVFGCAVVQGYGLTETAAAVSTMTPADTALALCTRPDLLGSVGRALRGTEIRVVDPAGRRVRAGATGEVVVRGPQLMHGYAGRPEATRAALRRGWLHTGDVGHLDAEGYLHLTDRLADVIVSGGENVYSAVVEQVLCAHPAVAEAAVVGVPDVRWGETVHAAVVLRPGAAATADDLTAYCRDRLGGVARPRSVEFLSALPRTSVGKVHKRALRAPFWAGHDRQVAGV
jgi:acyl-CoA synthetase (AMP-forming)/AMP-acid ligase II